MELSLMQDSDFVDDVETQYPNVTGNPDWQDFVDLLRNMSLSNETMNFGAFNATDWLETLDTLDQLANATIAILSVSRLHIIYIGLEKFFLRWKQIQFPSSMYKKAQFPANSKNSLQIPKFPK